MPLVRVPKPPTIILLWACYLKTFSRPWYCTVNKHCWIYTRKRSMTIIYVTYPLIKKPTNRLLPTFSPDFTLDLDLVLLCWKAWYFDYSYSLHCRAVPFCYGPKTMDTVNSSAVLANEIILRCIYAVVANNIRCNNLCCVPVSLWFVLQGIWIRDG